MAYAIYTTEALVCGSRASNTADKTYLLFTREAGMIFATARSVREERSKQRYALQDFSFIRVSLVKGKSGWRIGSVESEQNMFSSVTTREGRGGVASVVRLLRQFVHGEESHLGLFLDVKNVLQAFLTAPPETVQHLVDLFTLRLLHKLGYIAGHSSYQSYLDQDDWCDIEEELPQLARAATRQALQASHL